MVALAALAISINWATYIYAVKTGRVVEAALGYFINPLVTVLLGVLVLGERLRRAQWAPWASGWSPSWSSPSTTAGRRGVLGAGLLVRRLRAGQEDGRSRRVESLTLETACIAPVAAAYLVVLVSGGGGTFIAQGPGHALLLASTGLATALPLLASARPHPGADGDPRPAAVPHAGAAVPARGAVVPRGDAAGRWVGFALIWVALVVLSLETVNHHRDRRGVTAPARWGDEEILARAAAAH